MSLCPNRPLFWRAVSLLASTLAAVFIALDMAPKAEAAAPVRFVRVTTEQGLSQGTVQSMVQDYQGFLWFGTEEGLCRFDGYSFAVYKTNPKQPGSLPDNMISALYEDKKRQLWIGTEHGLCRYLREEDRFVSVQEIADKVTSILEDDDGNLWAASIGGGLNQLKPGATHFVSYNPSPKDPDTIPSHLLTTLFKDHLGQLWVGTTNAGLALYDPTAEFPNRFKRYAHDPADPDSLSDNNVWSIAEDREGNLWVACYGGGLNILDRKTGHFRHLRQDGDEDKCLPTDLITAITFDQEGALWVGTDGSGVLRMDARSSHFTSHVRYEGSASSMSANVVRSFYQDRQGHLWIGTFLGGANQVLQPRPGITHYNRDAADPEALQDAPVACFADDGLGGYWLGAENGWLDHYDANEGRFLRWRFPAATPAGTAILALKDDLHGKLWCGTYRGGLGCFNTVTETFTTFTHRQDDPGSLASDEIWDIAQDTDGLLWVATAIGLDHFDPQRGLVVEHIDRQLSDRELRVLMIDSGRRLWVGGLGGVTRYDPVAKTFTHYRYSEKDPSSLPNDFVISLREDHRGRIWVGTNGGGLAKLDVATGRFTRIEGLPSNSINGIQEDQSGDIWLSSHRGLSRLNPDTGVVDNFDLTNGLRSLQFHQGASLRLPGGRLLFGAMDGFYELQPSLILPSRIAPPLVLTDLKVFNETVRLPRPISLMPSLELSPRENVFTLDFAALDMGLPKGNRYAYQLEGFGDRWIELGDKHEVTFTNLDPGNYLFRVKACNSDGVWHEGTSASMPIRVLPPFWRTWWFRSAAFLAFCGLILTWHRLRVQRLTSLISERQRAAEARAELEAQLLQARKMEAIGTLAGGIAHDFNNILTAIIGNAQLATAEIPPHHPSHEALKHILQASYRARDVVRQILTYSRKESQERQPLEIQSIVKETLKLLKSSLPANIEIRSSLPSESQPVLADATQLHQVLMNLATNAAHAMEEKGGRFEVRMDTIDIDSEAVKSHPRLREGHFVRLIITDTGCGMDEETLKRIFEPYFTTKKQGKGTGLGLSVVYGIIQQHEGVILVYSEPDKGTTFQIYLPVTKTAQTAVPATPATPAPNGQGELIFVVDDEPLIIGVARGILTRKGYQTRTFLDPIEALEAFRAEPDSVDLIVSDLSMPRMKGTDMAAEIRKINRKVPIIICTGFDGATTEEELQSLDIIGPLLKPFTLESLSDQVAKALAARRSAQQARG
jgi:signal transduction histidine kinase/ligand-binding sensor domain-containing protein/CheY-like chemotaxis protein